MSEKNLNQSISLKEYISEKDYTQIKELEDSCSSQDKTNLKLELDYRLNMRKSHEAGLKKINEFLYYVDETLVAYINISCFGGNAAEVNGMAHPQWRRKGIFKKLFILAMEECKKRDFSKILLLSDDKSESGNKFIKSMGGAYEFSEYRMKQGVKSTALDNNQVVLRKAVKDDAKEISRQNSVFFNVPEEKEAFPEEEEEQNSFHYMSELNGEIIGKIKVKYTDDSAFIFGFGILPDYRGKGYGRATLSAALELINEKNINEVELDVECKNNTALNLYKSCGFEEQSAMNYYDYDLGREVHE